MLQFLMKLKIIHKISSRNSKLSVLIKIYLQSSLSSLSKEMFFYFLISSLTIGSSVKLITLFQNIPSMFDMSDLFFFFLHWSPYLMPLYESSSFSYSNAIMLLINSLQVWGASSFLVFTVIKLGHRITYANCEAVNTTMQSFRTTWP